MFYFHVNMLYKQNMTNLPFMSCFPPLVCFMQFSKEKYLLESPPEKLRKELEEELKLSPADIRSHGWYHGHIPREVNTHTLLSTLYNLYTCTGEYSVVVKMLDTHVLSNARNP